MGVLGSYTLGRIAKIAGEGKKVPMEGYGSSRPRSRPGAEKAYIRDRETCRLKVNMAFRLVQRVSQENDRRMKEEEERIKKEEEKKKEKELICVICLDTTKLRLLIWMEDGKRIRRFHHEKAEKLHCCLGASHCSCMQQWVEENGRFLLLFKCPHCRHLCCDDTEMEMFMDGEL